VRPHLEPTPFRHYPGLSALTGAETWVKHENFQPTGAFKVRGGINLVSRLDEDARRRGVIAASTGNHGQSVAYAARLFGVSAIICAPAAANRLKVASMEELGAEVVLHGERYDQAREHCEELARRHGYRYVHSGNEPLLIAGVATHTLEMLESRPDLDVIIVPIGGGSGAAGACVVAKAANPALEVIGVQSEEAPAAFLSWRGRRLVEAPNRTAAEGLATATAFELPQMVLRDHLSDFVLVSDAEIRRAVVLMLEWTRTLVEAAGAAPLAAAIKLRERLVCSGGNITPEQLRDLLPETPPA
jgi:threonine dehydratase